MKQRALLLLGLLMLISLGLFGQTEQQLLPAERKQQTLITQPITLYKGFLRIGLAAEYLNLGTLFDQEGNRENLDYNASLNTWFVTPRIDYGLTDRFQISLYVPYISQEGSASVLEEIPGLGDREFKREIAQRGIQDLRVQTIYQIMLENEKRPSLALSLNLTVPTGQKNPISTGDPTKEQVPNGQGHFSLTTSLNLRKINYPFVFNGRVDYEYRFPGTKSFELNEPEISFQNAAVLDISGQVGFHVNEWMAILNDINFNTITGDIMRDGIASESRENYRIDYSPTLTFQAKQLRINQILNFPVVGRNSTADPRFQIGVEYVF